MNQIFEWLTRYSPPIAALIVLGAALLFLTKLVVEKTIAAEFDAKTKIFEATLKRRSAFEEKVLSDRYSVITGLSARLERIMTNINRLRSGGDVPDGFMKQREIVPLTEIFEDIEIHRLVIGEDFHALFRKQAQVALDAANVSTSEAWRESAEQWSRLPDEIREASETAFGISKIHW